MILLALMQIHLISALVFLGMLASTAMAQDDGELERVATKVTQHIATQMPGWQNKRLIQPSKNVVIDFWSIPNRIVKISLIQQESDEETRTSLAKFARHEPNILAVKGLGDEAYSWGYGGSNIVFRRGKYSVWVSTNAEVDHDADAAVLSWEQKSERKISEERRLSKEFATRAADVINGAVPPAAQVRDIPKFAGESIPEPPQQKSAWVEPRIHLPVNLISASARLFDQGLADPRGMEYREIEIDLGRLWNRRFIIKTHGWILPGTMASQRFAVCWNGLVYPIVSIGNEADLHLDVETAIKADEEARAKQASDSSIPSFRLQGALPESYSLSATNLLPIRVCLLLRLGKTDVAERVWAAWTVGAEQRLLPDPYLVLAFDWLWAMYDRAINAHMRGDDRMCGISALMAEAAEKTIRHEIPDRPLLRGQPFAQAYLDCLKPLPLLIEDQERRAKHPRPTPAPRNGATLRQQTIAQLIEYLDEAFAVATSIPGGVDMSQDAVVEELIRRDKAAVEPLLNALENDTRLTRSVESSRPWHFDRHFITVYETALQALRRILSVGNEDFEDWETVAKGAEGRKTVAARLRKLAQQKGYLSLNLPPPF
jgi:hypothetical protein